MIVFQMGKGKCCPIPRNAKVLSSMSVSLLPFWYQGTHPAVNQQPCEYTHTVYTYLWYDSPKFSLHCSSCIILETGLITTLTVESSPWIFRWRLHIFCVLWMSVPASLVLLPRKSSDAVDIPYEWSSGKLHGSSHCFSISRSAILWDSSRGHRGEVYFHIAVQICCIILYEKRRVLLSSVFTS